MGQMKNRIRVLRRNATPAEMKLWNHLRVYRFYGYPFKRQVPICISKTGSVLRYFIADFYCLKLKLVIEVDGGYHNQQKAEDAARDGVIAYFGLKVIHFTNEEVLNNLESVIKQIEAEIPMTK